MGFYSAFKGLKLLKPPGNGRLNNLNNLNDPVLIVLRSYPVPSYKIFPPFYGIRRFITAFTSALHLYLS